MADPPTRTTRPITRLRVLRKEQLTPHMIRVVAGGDGLVTFSPNGFTDSYVKIIFPLPGVDYPHPFDMQTIRTQLPPECRPKTRSYTVRHYDERAGELAIDFVYHGDKGVAGPWAAAAKPGDEFMVSGPGGAYVPGHEADWHLLVGDESALPAIAATLEAVAPGTPVRAFVLVRDRSEEQPLATKGDAQITWLHRSAGGDLAESVRELKFSEGVVQAFVHGEAGFVRALRQHLLDERGVRRDLLSISGYWRYGKDDEGWRAEKAAERAKESNA